MNAKNTPLRLKKLPYNLALILLTAGASLILGFLSFGGMYALIPLLPVAFASFGLSVAYEGEIYLQNIKGALSKLFKRDYLENHLAKEYLLAHFPTDDELDNDETPQFFRDYKNQLQLLAEFGNKTLDKDSKKTKKQIKKTLADMEKRFAVYLFGGITEKTPYATELCTWLEQQQQDAWQERLASRKKTFNWVKGFSLLSAAFMGLGSTYLIVEAFSIIPFFATISFTLWPIIILPMALVAGAAYGMLTFNAVTDLINNNTVVKWYNKIKNDLSQGLSIRNVFMATMSLLLVSLAIALTLCTAGTWWTIATSARPLFDWMHRIPSFMGVLNAAITGTSTLAFTIQNTQESTEMLDELSRGGNVFKQIAQAIKLNFKNLYRSENWLQILNPFRLVLFLTIMPLRIALFFGHLLSIAVTADRPPFLSKELSAFIAIISEGFEDAHYFIGHSHEHEHGHSHDAHEGEHDDHHHHETNESNTKELLKERLSAAGGHSHSNDIPTWILKTIALPIYALAAAWDTVFSRFNSVSAAANQPAVISWSHAWNKHRGISEESTVTLADQAHPSYKWQQEHALAQINKYERKHLAQISVGSAIAEEKKAQLKQFKDKIVAATQPDELVAVLKAEKEQTAVYNQHRLFARAGELTRTQEFINDLPQRVNVPAA